MRFEIPDHHIHMLLFQAQPLLQHGVGFPHAGRVPQIDFKGSLPLTFDEFRKTIHDHPPDTESASFLARLLEFVKSQIEAQHIDLWFTPHAPFRAFHMATDELFHRFQGQAAGFGHAPGLHQGRFRGNVGIKAASRSGQHIHGQHAFGPFGTQLLFRSPHALGQRLAGGAIVGAGRRTGVIPGG